VTAWLPYHGRLVAILVAMVVQTLMGLAAPWPVKVVDDDVMGGHSPPSYTPANPVATRPERPL